MTDNNSILKNSAVLILSGGLDSTTLLYDLISQGKKVYAISFNYGQKHNKELEFAAKTCQKLNVPHKIVDLTGLQKANIFGKSSLTSDTEIPEGHYQEESMKSTVVPNRNMIMLSLAISYAISLNIDEVYYGAHAGDHAIYPDCRPTFVERMNAVAQVCHYYPIKVIAPYLNISKADIVKKGLQLNVDYSLTWTCYKGGDKACGKCGSCVERREAFAMNNAKDPLEYE
ncbi:MAG: 7-cyano-7-deazaguanine synthase QueC [Promethearchaeota archaeon]